MPRIEAQPERLGSAGSRQSEISARTLALSNRLTQASEASCAAGDPSFSQAISDALTSWNGSLTILSVSVGGLADNLSAAASAYSGTDAAAMPTR